MTTTFEPITHGGSAPDGNPVGLILSGVHDDASFAEVLAAGTIEDTVDMGGFRLHVGFDEHQQVAFYLENGMRDCPHLVISAPFTAREWLHATGDTLNKRTDELIAAMGVQ